MRFLVDANVPLSVAPLIRSLGNEATGVREIGMGSADDSVIARHARDNAFCLITRDKDFGDIRNYPPGDYSGIVVLDLPEDFTATEVLRILEVFLSRKEWLERLPGRLAIVEPSRVRFRPS
jgi:predicted nuclease of predicted toxin-antitoxin system